MRCVHWMALLTALSCAQRGSHTAFCTGWKHVGESYWPNTLDLYNRDSELMTDFDQLGYGMRWKKSGCRACLMDEICMGIWREHAEEFSRSGVRPICEGGSV